VHDLLDQPVDLLLLLVDDLLELGELAPAVAGGDAGTAAVVAAGAGTDEVVGGEEQVGPLRAGDDVVDGGRPVGAARPLDSAGQRVEPLLDIGVLRQSCRDFPS
jgi:hypothetical protein